MGFDLTKSDLCPSFHQRPYREGSRLGQKSLVLDMRVKFKTLQGQVDMLYGRRLEFERERLKTLETQLIQEVNGLRQDRAAIVVKVVPHVATKLVPSDEMGLLVICLSKAAFLYGRCTALEEVAALKEPFELEKMPGYCPLSKKEFDRAGYDLANASYPFLAEVTTNPYAPLEVLLSKKPKSLRAKPISLKSKPLSLQAHDQAL
uniref:Uncharacterized protein n=1 Tax=Tanacetum cinerariifolium TaxID=118510 RepID=A0A699GY83_TANCI|nr:hypothetical protein [Tanacetum cinerariifolium]